MRTVILNTLGSTFAKKDVFYRAFAPEQLLWLNYGFHDLAACANALISHAREQLVRQDYHLIVLADLERYRDSEFQNVRALIKKLLTASLHIRLFPILERADLLPESVSVICTFFQNRDGGVKDSVHYLDLLWQPEEPGRLVLRCDREQDAKLELDFSDTFADVLAQLETPSPRQKAPSREHRDALQAILDNLPREEKKTDAAQTRVQELLSDKVGSLQIYKSARNPDRPIQPAVWDFPFLANEPSLANADLQINLSRLIREVSQRGAVGQEDKKLSLRPHTPEQLTGILADAQASAQSYLEAPEQTYYALTEPYSYDSAAQVEQRIRERLRGEMDTLPGVREALEVLEEAQTDEPADDDPRPTRRLRAAFLRVGAETRRFRQTYSLLQSQYNSDRVRADQEKLLDICAGEFLDWRGQICRGDGDPGVKPTLKKRPALPQAPAESLDEVRRRRAEGVLEKLNDFADVRKEAAELDTRFRSVTRLWSPERREQAGGLFFRFSVGMALLFVLVMTVPFLLIESLETGAKLPRIALFAMNYGVFLALYGVGVLAWLRALSKKIRGLTMELEDLLYHSADARRQSVLRAIETYGQLLPACLLQQRNRDAVETADAKNARLEALQRLHIAYLNEALNEIQDLRTALRLPELPGGKARPGKLDYHQPPYAPCNQEAYMLFCEREGRK